MTGARASGPRVAIAVLCGTTGGPATYGLRLVRALAALDALRLTVLTDCARAFDGIGPGADGLDVVEVACRGGIDRLRWQYHAVPRALRRASCDLFHDTKNALPRRLRCPAVVTVHDLAYYRCPESFGFLPRTFLRRATDGAVRRAARVVVPSEATARDVRAIYPRAGESVRVVPHGIDPFPGCTDDDLARVRRRYGLPDCYVLHVGTVQARKNVDLLVRAVRALRSAGLPHRCVVVGRRGWLAGPAFAEIARDDTALYLGVVPSEDLPAIYRAADLFVSPSAYEGFGFTVADALAAGTPVAISDRSSLPEVCGAAARTFHDLSADGVAAAIEPLLRDPAARAALAEAGRRRALEFTWERAAQRTLAVYRECLRDR